MKTLTISSLEDLERFANTLAEELKGGEVLGLVGDLGAGKTTFTQLLAKALGVKGDVRSPTFVLMQQYKLHGKTLHTLCHVDAYRLKDSSELRTIGLDDFAGAPGVVTVVEWADRVPELHKLKGYREITFVLKGKDERILRIGE